MRGRRPRAPAIVPDDDEPLRRRARSHSAPWFQVRRARIVLAVTGGERVQTIATSIQCDPATVRRTSQRYRRPGLDGLLAPPQRPGRPPRISPPAAGPDRGTHPFEWTWTNQKLRAWFSKHATSFSGITYAQRH